MWHRAFERIERGRLPVVAVLKGAVVGGGLELAVGDAHPGGRAERLLRPARGAARAVRRRRRLGAGAAADRGAPDGRHDAHRPGRSTPRRGRRWGCRTT